LAETQILHQEWGNFPNFLVISGQTTGSSSSDPSWEARMRDTLQDWIHPSKAGELAAKTGA